MSCSPSASVPPSILYNSLSQRFRPILDRYNREFCKIPLTSDLRINPFRYRTDLDPEPIFLVHAVMALAGHHVESPSTQNHRHAALQLLRESLNTYSNAGDGYSMLDTIIILFSLDETQSALGNWSTHLVGAYGLLEACGGIEGWATSARAEAQIGMLTWWDAITSLVSREDCVFPYAYFEAVLSNHNGREWDFFGLCGCPPSLVKIVMQLARLSAEKRKSSSMRYVTFDTTVISEIEQSLESWHHISPATAFQGEECMQQDQDSMHCSEAWRNGLLLYIYRVFQWEPGSSIPMHILYRARVIVDHVVAGRDESMVSRQALLPLFFAGCELRDRSLRKKIVKFCSVWNERTRYHMFSSTIPLLEEVWAEQETKGFENVWWGQVVDKQHKSESRYPLQMRICFG
ncbi:fungal-specific transcription factor domain-containing protein [Lipomyces starkeyi]